MSPLSGHRYKCQTCGLTYGSPTVLAAHQAAARPKHKGYRTVKVLNRATAKKRKS